jgi:proteasome lid subunit RPN8/RPN11
MLIVPATVLRKIQAHGESAFPNEGAGLLLGQAAEGNKTVVDILPLNNEWESGEQYHRYLITPQDMLRGEDEAARRGLDVIGIFHSHPDHVAEPSAMDRDWALPWFSYIITSVRKAHAVVSRSWLLRDDRTAFDEENIQAAPEGGAPGGATF